MRPTPFSVPHQGQPGGNPQSAIPLPEEAANEIRIEAAAVDSLIANYESNRQLPPLVDRPLLGLAKKQFGILSRDELEKLRAAFIEALRKNRPTKPLS